MDERLKMMGFRDIGERTCLGGVLIGLEADVAVGIVDEVLNFKGDTGLAVVALAAESKDPDVLGVVWTDGEGVLTGCADPLSGIGGVETFGGRDTCDDL